MSEADGVGVGAGWRCQKMMAAVKGKGWECYRLGEGGRREGEGGK